MTFPLQSSLFDDEPNGGTRIVEVLARSKPTDKAQAAFHRLVSKIERQRESLKAWQDYLARYNQRLTDELMPLQGEFMQTRRQMAFLLDELLGQPSGLRGKSQRAKLRQLLLELSRDMLQEETDAELEALHDKHSDVSHAEGLDEGMALSQAMIEDMFGIDLGDQHGAVSMEELFSKAEEELFKQRGNARQEDTASQPRRRASRKAEAAQAKREQAAKEVSQSVRDVYRKLASALHPDRETDVALRQRKTEQMQRVNQAYEAGDLLELLNLQLEIEQIDATHLSSIPQQRLTHYNQVLRDQLAELDAEIEALVMPFHMVLAQSPFFGPITPESVDRELSAAVARMRLDIDGVKNDLVTFRDPKLLKQALKDYHPLPDDDMEGLEDLAFLADMLGPSVRTPRAKRRK